jgi:hypothetical protein
MNRTAITVGSLADEGDDREFLLPWLSRTHVVAQLRPSRRRQLVAVPTVSVSG